MVPDPDGSVNLPPHFPLTEFDDEQPFPCVNEIILRGVVGADNPYSERESKEERVCPQEFRDTCGVGRCLVEIVPLMNPMGTVAMKCVYEPCAVGNED